MTEVALTGYEGETISAFVHKLQADVKAVIDIREIPLSRKKGFSKNTLAKTLWSRGIEYHHFKELGSPSEIRNQLRSDGDYIDFFEKYKRHARKNGGILKNVLKIIHSKHSALLCFEKDCELCHRTIVASELQRLSHQKLLVTQL